MVRKVVAFVARSYQQPAAEGVAAVGHRVFVEPARQQGFGDQPEGDGDDRGPDKGYDRNAGRQKSIMTIITEADGRLVTAFPGAP
jgi:hypothetical protein